MSETQASQNPAAPVQTPAAPAATTPSQQPASTTTQTPAPSPDLASLHKLVEGLSKELSDIKAATAKPADPAKPEPTEAEKVLTQRYEADIAALKPEHAAAVKEIAGNDALLGMRIYTALQKAGMFVTAEAKPTVAPAPTDKQNLDGTTPSGGGPKNWAEATSRIAASIANPRL